jgi:hypothetical protein
LTNLDRFESFGSGSSGGEIDLAHFFACIDRSMADDFFSGRGSPTD